MELGGVRMAETDAIGKILLRFGLLALIVPSTKTDSFVYIVKTNLAKKSWNALLGMWIF